MPLLPDKALYAGDVTAFARGRPPNSRYLKSKDCTAALLTEGARAASDCDCPLTRVAVFTGCIPRGQLLTFCNYPGEVEATNNGSERKLRPCVIQRKVTNGYRAMWAAKAEADLRTTIDTARLKGTNASGIMVATMA